MMRRFFMVLVVGVAAAIVGYFVVTSTAVPKYEVVREDSVDVEVFSFVHVELRHDGQLDQRKAEKIAKDYLKKIGAKRGIVVVEDNNSSFTFVILPKDETELLKKAVEGFLKGHLKLVATLGSLSLYLELEAGGSKK